MGMIFRKQYTMPAPAGAEIVERDGVRVARWRLRNGQLRTGEVVACRDGRVRVRGQTRCYVARYRDGTGQVVEIATNCKDEVAARAVLTQLERRAELVRAGVMTAAEDCAADYVGLPLSKHLDAYERHLRAKGGDPRRISMLRRRIERLTADCHFTKLSKMSPGPVERWLAEQADAGMSASTRNSYRESLVCFANWARRAHEAELLRLLHVARLRPLAEYGRAVAKKAAPRRSRRSRATWRRGPLTFENLDAAVERAREALKDNRDLIAQLERTGHERALIYKMLVLTGLRKGELASLSVGQLDFTGPVAYASLNPGDEKNRQGSSIPLRADLADELSMGLAERLAELQEQARRSGRPIPAKLPPPTPLFEVPSGLCRIFDRDLAVARISKRDERNRVLDIHSLRVTFGTHLCAAGVPLRTAQAAMRHCKPELTATVYVDPALLDVAGAIAALPTLPLAPQDAKRPAEVAS